MPVSGRTQSSQGEKFSATSHRQGRLLQPRSYGRSDGNPTDRGFNGSAMGRNEERAHGPFHLGFADPGMVGPGRQREGLRQNSFQWEGEINRNPFHTCIVRRSEVSTKTVIRLGR